MKLIVHGGFFSESNTDADTKRAKQKALVQIAKDGFDFLKTHSASETVVYTVELLENNPLFNAGIGSQIQRDGKIRMSAALMDGSTQKFSGVMNIQDVQNPIRVAEILKDYDDRVIGGIEATQFARTKGIAEFSTRIPSRIAEYESKKASVRPTSTVGCVALDADGNLAAATSTGGKGFEVPGRISDSATVAGNYANRHCAVSCTGVGEDITSNALAAKIVTRVSDGMKLQTAFQKTFSELKEIDGFAGAIGITQNGEIYHADSHPKMVFASFDGKVSEVFE